jgi:hypothetical protein
MLSQPHSRHAGTFRASRGEMHRSFAPLRMTP